MKTIHQAECQKLSGGALTYELGVDNGEQYVRIASNQGGGRFSNEWVPLKTIEELLSKSGPAFSSTLFRDAFISKSTNNAGFLAAILKTEHVIGPNPGDPKKLTFLSLDNLRERFPKANERQERDRKANRNRENA